LTLIAARKVAVKTDTFAFKILFVAQRIHENLG